MPVYSYKALNTSGNTIHGEIAAHSKDELSLILADKGMLMQSASPIRIKRSWRLLPQKSVHPQELLLFNQEFLALVKAGITIPVILEMMQERPEQPVLQKVVSRLLEEVKKGKTLSDAAAEHPEVFDSLYLTSLKTGEKSGNIVSTLQRYQRYLKLRVAIQKKIQQAMAYPLFLLITLVFILIILFTFVLPRFVEMYADFGAELPFATWLLMKIIKQSYIYLPLLSLSMISGYFLYRYWVATEAGKYKKDLLLLHTPVIKQILKLNLAGQVTHMLATLISSGMPLVEAMAATAESASNRVITKALWLARKKVTEGIPLYEALKELDILQSTAIKIIQAGESAGNLDEMLTEVAEYQESMLEHQLTRLMSFIEPLMMLLMGVFIGGIIFVMYLPIFSVADIIQ